MGGVIPGIVGDPGENKPIAWEICLESGDIRSNPLND